MRPDDPLRGLRPAHPPSSLRERVLSTAAQQPRRLEPLTASARGASGNWILAVLVLLFAHLWVTWASERAAGDLLRGLGIPDSRAARSPMVFFASEFE